MPLWLSAQLYTPNESTIYDDSDLPRIDITISQEDLDQIFAPGNEENDEEFPVTFSFVSDQRADFEEHIGFRIRGNTSRYSAKKSFKVSFNTFESGRDLDGFEKLNLNGEHNDPSIIRSKLCWDMMNAMGVPAPRANHVAFYINDEYRGLYISVEHIDEEFVQERFDNKDGNLYKCLYPADLQYLGDNPDLYKFESGGRRAYELKRNEEADDYSGLARLIKVLNETPEGSFEAAISEVFDVKSYLKALAVETLTAHWDNYGVNQNNFYLYDNPADGKFYYIPYDMDNTLGIDWLDEDWAAWNIYEWFRDDRPLTKRLMDVQAFREEYTRQLDVLLRRYFNPNVLNPRIDELKTMIQAAAEQDEFRTYDYGWSMEDFNSSYISRLVDFHVRYGLKPFIQRRYETAHEQLEEVILLHSNSRPAAQIYPNPSNGVFTIALPAYVQNATLSIYSLTGQQMYQQVITGSSFKIDPKLQPGTYLIRFIDSKLHQAVSQKLIIR